MMHWMSVLRELNMVSVTIRLLLALVAGTLIGIDRGMKRRGAGIKTHVLVCLGATLVMMTGQYTFNYKISLNILRDVLESSTISIFPISYSPPVFSIAFQGCCLS